MNPGTPVPSSQVQVSLFWLKTRLCGAGGSTSPQEMWFLREVRFSHLTEGSSKNVLEKRSANASVPSEVVEVFLTSWVCLLTETFHFIRSKI